MTEPQPERRTYHTGDRPPAADVDGQLIATQAQAAAQSGQSLHKACPYDFSSEAGQKFVRVFHRHRAKPIH